MPRKHKPILPYDSVDSQPLAELFEVASCTECTGLIPSAPQDSQELSSYEDLREISMEQKMNPKNSHEKKLGR